MKKNIFGFIILFLIIISFAFFTKSSEITVPETNQQRIDHGKNKTVEDKKTHDEIRFDRNEVQIVKTKDDEAPTLNMQDLIKSKHVPDKYFHDWSDDEFIKDALFDTWGKNFSETFFTERDNKKLLDRSRGLSDENDFLSKFRTGIYRGYAFLMKRDDSYGPDPQPFIIFLNKEKINGKSIIKAQWISWKKATGVEGIPHPVWQSNFKSNFQEENVYKNVISFSEEALGPMF